MGIWFVLGGMLCIFIAHLADKYSKKKGSRRDDYFWHIVDSYIYIVLRVIKVMSINQL